MLLSPVPVGSLDGYCFSSSTRVPTCYVQLAEKQAESVRLAKELAEVQMKLEQTVKKVTP